MRSQSGFEMTGRNRLSGWGVECNCQFNCYKSSSEGTGGTWSTVHACSGYASHCTDSQYVHHRQPIYTNKHILFAITCQVHERSNATRNEHCLTGNRIVYSPGTAKMYTPLANEQSLLSQNWFFNHQYTHWLIYTMKLLYPQEPLKFILGFLA